MPTSSSVPLLARGAAGSGADGVQAGVRAGGTRASGQTARAVGAAGVHHAGEGPAAVRRQPLGALRPESGRHEEVAGRAAAAAAERRRGRGQGPDQRQHPAEEAPGEERTDCSIKVDLSCD